MRCAFLCHEFLLGGRKKKPSTVASHILIRSVSTVYKNTYLLMCLFLLAVRNTPDKQNLFGLSGSAGGVWARYCVLGIFHSLFGRIFFPGSGYLWLQMVNSCSCIPLSWCSCSKGWVMFCPHPCPDTIQAWCYCASSQEAGDILDILSLVRAMSPAQHFLVSKQIYLSFKCKIKMTLFFFNPVQLFSPLWVTSKATYSFQSSW